MSITPGKRIQGRPARGEGDVGRERLIEAAREVLRSSVLPDLSRKAVADAAGVTPALVSYYFPDKNSLMMAATGPLMGTRIAQLLCILDGGEERHDKLRRIVQLFVGLNADEAHLVDHTIAICTGDNAEASPRTQLLATYGRLRTFYLDGVEAGEWRSLDADVFLFALWGMCKFAAQTKATPTEVVPSQCSRSAVVIDLAFNGLRHR